MIVFRPHKGSLYESLRLAMEFDSVEKMYDYIKVIHHDLVDYFSKNRNELCPPEIRDTELCVDEKVVYDKRCGWNTRYVLCYGNCIGMCDLNWKKVEDGFRTQV